MKFKYNAYTDRASRCVDLGISLPNCQSIFDNETVGSLPRPTELQAAYRDFDANLISHEEFVAAQDKAVVDSLNLMTSTGQDFITDGEMRHSSFATYPLTE